MLPPPALSLLSASLAAVAAAAGGAWVGAQRPATASSLAGWASALAAGVMLGVGYALMAPAVQRADVAATVGAALGTLVSHVLRERTTADPVAAAAMAPEAAAWPRPRAALRASALHAAAEGVAVGAALAAGGAFGLALAWTVVAHNAAEGLALGALLAREPADDGGEPARAPAAAARAAALARTSQVVLAGATFALLGARGDLLPWALGAGFGALFYLVLAELLPAAYAVAGRTGIAVIVTLAAGLVALLGGGALDATAWAGAAGGR